jgi:F-type H+-transporting ATPase subunit a
VDITPDQIVYGQWGIVTLNATILWTWVVMAVLAAGSWAVTRGLTSYEGMGRGQNILEGVVSLIERQIRDISDQAPQPYLAFVGTLFLFISLSNLLSIVPGYRPPTGSLSTTAALAVCVFVAVPIFGIRRQGLRRYLGQYLQPSIVMLPFTIIGELSRTLALAVRLFGNVMSGTVIAALLLGVAPLLFPVVAQMFGLLIGVIQAYIFSILAMVYIASATRAHDGTDNAGASAQKGGHSHG